VTFYNVREKMTFFVIQKHIKDVLITCSGTMMG